MKTKNNRRGFTIVELVIVIAVIAILATVLVPAFGGIIEDAQNSKAMQQAKNAYTEYFVESNGAAAEYAVYEADGCFVALKSGAPVGVYDNKEDALVAMVKDGDPALLADVGDGLWVYGAAPSVDNGGTTPEPDQKEFPTSFTGLKVSVLGDSISTYNGSGSKNNVYPNSSVVAQSDTWWAQVISALGMELLVNNASGGSRILSDEYFNGGGIRDGNYAAYRDRCVNLHSGSETPDVIIVFLGTNDFSYHFDENCSKCAAMKAACTDSSCNGTNICAVCRALSRQGSSYCTLPLGTADGVDATAENPSSTCEAYAVMLNKMQEAYPDAFIYCLSLLPRVNPYQNATYHDHGQPTAFNAELKKVAEATGAKFISLENCVSNSASSWSTYFGDPVHPGASGMDMISAAVIDGMLGENATHTVSWNLNGVTIDNKNCMVMNGNAFSVNLTAKAGYALSSVKVTMGGSDITSACYANGKVTISAVTDDITVTTSATLDLSVGIVWEVGALNTQNGEFVSASSYPHRISSNFIDVSNGVRVSVLNDAEFCPVYYDANFKFVSSPGAYQTSVLTLEPGQYAYMRLMARNKNATNDALKVTYNANICVSNFADPMWTVVSIDSSSGLNAYNNWTKRITTGYMNVTTGANIAVLGGNIEYYVFYYDKNFTLVAQSTAYSTSELTIPAGQYVYMRIMARNQSTPDATLSAAYGKSLSVTIGSTSAYWESGTIHTGTGEDTADGTRIRTGWIDIRSGAIVSTTGSAQINVVYYDKDMNIIANSYSGWTSSGWNSANAPDGVVYVRIVARDGNGSNAVSLNFEENITLVFE